MSEFHSAFSYLDMQSVMCARVLARVRVRVCALSRLFVCVWEYSSNPSSLCFTAAALRQVYTNTGYFLQHIGK